MKILIVNDDAESREQLLDGLSEGEQEIFAAESADEAWERLKRDPVQIILIKWAMPTLDDMELVRAIHAADFDQYPYIILICDPEFGETVISALGAIPGDWLPEPVDMDELRTHIAVGERFLALQSRLASERQRQLASTIMDEATGALNYRAIYDRAKTELERGMREGNAVALVLIDIDELAKVNEEYGEAFGDQVMRLVAHTTQVNVRGYDVVGRWDAGNFLVVLPGANAENAASTAKRIHGSLEAMGLPLQEGGHLRLHTHMGVTSMDSDNQAEMAQLIEQAAAALESAKQDPDQKIGLYQAGQE